MTNEEKEIRPAPVLLSVKRHINMGDRSFQNTETTIYGFAKPELADQRERLREIRRTLNIWEKEERKNYLEMQRQIRKQEEELQEREQFEANKKDAEFRKVLLEHIEANPGCGIDDLLLTFETSRYTLDQHLDQLVLQNKLQRKPCREAFIKHEDPEFDDLEDMDDMGDTPE